MLREPLLRVPEVARRLVARAGAAYSSRPWSAAAPRVGVDRRRYLEAATPPRPFPAPLSGGRRGRERLAVRGERPDPPGTANGGASGI